VLNATFGRAYQAADDLLDATADAGRLGKPVGQDAARGRPSAVHEYGFERARVLTASLLWRTLTAIPSGTDPAPVRHCVEQITHRFTGLGLLSGPLSAEGHFRPAPATDTGVRP
jgi:geranylgeranyl diphosphate synthase type II